MINVIDTAKFVAAVTVLASKRTLSLPAKNHKQQTELDALVAEARESAELSRTIRVSSTRV
jgi:hypothetical protein